MNAYVYYYKVDSSCEPIGRVMATSLYEALNYIMQIKQLSEESVTDLFEIKKLDTYENNL
jgi:hypothetical protein